MIVEMTREDRMRDLHKQETTRNDTDTRLIVSGLQHFTFIPDWAILSLTVKQKEN